MATPQLTTWETATVEGGQVPAMNDAEKMLKELEPLRESPGIYDFGDGCRIGLRESRAGGSVYIMNVQTGYRSRGQGAASTALAQLCEVADAFQVELFLEVEVGENGGLDTVELLDWYHRFGFKGDAGEMVREPLEP